MAAIYCTTTWCFALKGLRTMKRCHAYKFERIVMLESRDRKMFTENWHFTLMVIRVAKSVLPCSSENRANKPKSLRRNTQILDFFWQMKTANQNNFGQKIEAQEL